MGKDSSINDEQFAKWDRWPIQLDILHKHMAQLW